ncbi:MAG: hypothetical protein GY835_12650 [bacterium]|nr:hypothetical protein [bacterium]
MPGRNFNLLVLRFASILLLCFFIHLTATSGILLAASPSAEIPMELETHSGLVVVGRVEAADYLFKEERDSAGGIVPSVEIVAVKYDIRVDKVISGSEEIERIYVKQRMPLTVGGPIINIGKDYLLFLAQAEDCSDRCREDDRTAGSYEILSGVNGVFDLDSEESRDYLKLLGIETFGFAVE